MAYNSEKLLQLLQICSWKSNSSLDNPGLAVLADKIDAKIRREGGKANEFVPDQKYLRALQRKLVKNIELGVDTGSNAKYIENILNYQGFSDWDTYTARMLAAEEFIDIDKIDPSKYKEAKISFFVANEMVDTVRKNVAFATDKLDFSVDIFNSKSTNPEETLLEILHLSETSQFIVWVVTDTWNEQLKDDQTNENLKKILDSGRVIVVRMSQDKTKLPKRVSFNTALRPPYGTSGLLIALAAINQCQQKFDIRKKTGKAPLGGKVTISKLINNSGGTVTMGEMKQENHGGNNVMGGNIVQNFSSKED